ncbi:hypothetical protein BC833DRAFT_622563 [Globomyces pollinis-pini]|nr:hypothetical protein BC833DRAFT_622563 [Globomyces pollinis-pini]
MNKPQFEILQSLYPPQEKTQPKNKVLHSHIHPPFCKRIPINNHPLKVTNKTQNLDYPKLQDCKWSLDIPVIVRQHKSQNARVQTVRMTIESDFECEYPQSHKIKMLDPLNDLFFHWTFNCTPFTYRTLVGEMKWILPSTADDAFQDTFRRFGYLIQDCANKVSRQPNRYQANIHVTADNEMATLVFTELVNGYRTIELLSLPFLQSSWIDIQADIRWFTSKLMNEHEVLKLNLIQVMEIVSINHPSLLLYLDNLYDSQTTWNDKHNLKLRQDMGDNFIPIHSKLVPITITTDHTNDETKDLIFNFLYNVMITVLNIG